MENGRFCIYTVITGDHDELITPNFRSEGCDYICFSDVPRHSDFWDVKLINIENLDRVRGARRVKIMPHLYLKDYDRSLYIDGNFDITGDFFDYIKTYLKSSSMLCIEHPQRDCIYAEAEACIKLNKDDPLLIMNQMLGYAFEGYPRKNQLIASGVIYRRHNDPILVRLNEAWWAEVRKKSRRDQLSFNYVCHKYGYVYDVADVNYFSNKYFERFKHKS